MKKLILFIAAVAISHAFAFSQGCLPEGITFTSQAQIDSFQINYPGCTVIEGDVFMNGDVFNLSGLSLLKSIGGSLILDCVQIMNLSGLDSLTTIGVDFGLFATNLVNLDGLGSLVSIGGDLTIGSITSSSIQTNNPYLVNLEGLESLTSIGGNLSIIDCWSLTEIQALSGLITVNGIDISHNRMLQSLSGLENIDANSVSGLSIHDNDSLSECNVQGLCTYLSNPGGFVDIYRNNTGCNTINEVAYGCGITLSCLPFGNYWFTSQTDVDNFQGNFTGCNSLNGSVYIIASDITNLNGLSTVTSIAGGLVIGHEWLGGGNPLLESLAGLENIDSIEGTLHIQYNPLLTTMSGMQNLTYIGGSLNITGNDGMVNLTGLENLTAIGAGIGISGNDAMVNLSGLENVTTAGSYILIRFNDDLTSLTGLDNIEAGSITDLRIYSNDKLADCAVKSICDYLAIPGGNVEIGSNAPGCNSPVEVQEVCLSSSEALRNVDKGSFYPNPGKDFLIISTQNGVNLNEVIIYNLACQKVLKGKPVYNTLDISKLQPGMYIIELVTNQGNMREKLVVE
jgi:hypothetical protein